jgi:ABC-type lipopolysaccharide export system ATPase subunit
LRNLSSGVKKLVEIDTLLYADSSFLLLDEPFSFLSPVLVEQLIPHIQYQATIKGIILTDHQFPSVSMACNKFYQLSEGSLEEVDIYKEYR